ncbi:Carbon-nitrogen hydrolase [Rhizoctonia solani]|uniref:Carbon-nitrogen hydrolase n=1 Tax=Rhizoctonia solani TaxID=456999 RepID=A0A8H7IEP5_9AGAM|nr:Carbon-nitrogen hydrolase [Rhizoctonia solani]
MPQVLKVSVVQTCTAAYSLNDTLNKLDRLVRLAKERDGSHPPEDSSHPTWQRRRLSSYSTFGAVVGSRAPEGRDEFLRYHSAAITLSPESPGRVRIESIARAYGVFLVVGVIEKDSYASSAGKHRKLMPTATERLVWGTGDGTTLPVLEHEFSGSEQEQSSIKAKLSAAICWDPPGTVRTHYYSKGVQLYCTPTVDSRPAWQNTVTHIALEGRCFVLSACQYAQQKDFPEGHAIPAGTKPDPEAVMIGGGSVIIGPLGEVLAGPLRDGEGILTAEVDLEDCIRGKLDLDVVGHYARPDIFKLLVEEQL